MENTVYKRSAEGQKEPPRKLALKFKERSILLTKKFTIGRDSGCDIPLPNDSLVSRTHAIIEFRNGTYEIKDAGSTNGTYVNKVPLRKGECRVLNPGDQITLGKTTITVDGAMDS